jgi:hypothetical protein
VWQQNEFSSADSIKDMYRLFPETIPIVFKEEYISILKQLLGNNAVCLPESVVHFNRFFDWHKDTTYLSHMTKEDKISEAEVLLQCGYYLQDNTSESGGLTIIPKSFNTKDRFVKMHFGNLFYRLYYKLLKKAGISPFQSLEKHGNPLDLPTKAGDLLIFNNKIDHRATFIRGKDHKPVYSKNNKIAIFNTFGKNKLHMDVYRNSLAYPNEPYANFLRNDTLPEALDAKGKELDFEFCYNTN